MECKVTARNEMEGKENGELIRLEDVYKIYKMGEETVRAADGISLTIKKNEMVAIVGQSGSGKSTCMNIIGCLDVPTKGKYYLEGQDVSHMSDDQQADIRNRSLGFIFQQYNLIPKLDVLENVELPLIYKGISERERHERAKAALEKVGILSKMHNMPSQLSGGQQQRVSIARALAGDPPIILADEPTGALDSKTSEEVLSFLQQLNAEGNTIVLITHDMEVAKKAKRIVRIADGRIVEDFFTEYGAAAGESTDRNSRAARYRAEGNDRAAGYRTEGSGRAAGRGSARGAVDAAIGSCVESGARPAKSGAGLAESGARAAESGTRTAKSGAGLTENEREGCV